MTITLLLILGKSVREAMIHIILIFFLFFIKLKNHSHRIFPKIHARKKQAHTQAGGR